MSDQRYLVAARKYRPALFEEIVAQEHVTDTLKNAIRLDRLAHAYLFSGPRGVGKTTAARVLAKAINCTTPLDARTDRAEPCRECDSCRAFEDGRSLNIFEIDAASNNKVDDIRELRETVRIPPQGSKKKVYIIDEVHMLSKQAFNALLKTLEEPPPHALFIFATTEPHKVLPTILSRCQRFDFRRIPVPEVVDRLHEICEAEAITADEESLMLIARKGDGALRDALSAFDQAVSLCGTTLEYAELAQAMGVVDLDLFFRLTDHVSNQNSAGVLQLVDHIVREGYDLQEFLAGLAEHLRNLLVGRTMDDDTLIEAAAATRQRYVEAGQPFAETDLLRLLMIAGDAEEAIQSSSQPRLKLEMALLKMASVTHAVDLRAALAKIDELEQRVDDGTLPAISPTDDTPTTTSASPTDDLRSATTAEPTTDYAAAPSPKPPADELPASAEPAEEASGNHNAKDDSAETDSKTEPAPEADDEANDPSPAPPRATDDAPSNEGAGSEDTEDASDAPPPSPQTGYRDLFGKPALQQTRDATPDDESNQATNQAASSWDAQSMGDGGIATTPASDQSGATSPEELQQLSAVWGDFVQSVMKTRIRVGSCLQHAAPVEVQDGTARIAVPDAFHRRQLSEHEALLADHLSDILDRSVDRFRFVVEETPSPTGRGETTSESDPYERMRTLRNKYPVIDMLFDDFGGELVW